MCLTNLGSVSVSKHTFVRITTHKHVADGADICHVSRFFPFFYVYFLREELLELVWSTVY